MKNSPKAFEINPLVNINGKEIQTTITEKITV